MKSSKFILALWLGSCAWAQTPAPKQQVTPSASTRPNTVKPVSPSASLPKPAPAPANAAKVSGGGPKVRVQPVVGTVKPGPAPTKPATAKPSGRTAASRPVSSPRPPRKQFARHAAGRKAAEPVTAAAKEGSPKPSAGRRDPFVSPVVERVHAAAVCTGTGRQCLLVGEITLQGVVHSSSGFVAVVVNGEHTYFLRENDPLANGAVERITNNAIILRERSSDALGRPFTREVTRRIGSPAV